MADCYGAYDRWSLISSRYPVTARARDQGYVRLVKDLEVSIHDRHVLFVEMWWIPDDFELSPTNLYARQPATLEVCALFNKPNTADDIPIKYKGFDLPINSWLVMDWITGKISQPTIRRFTQAYVFQAQNKAPPHLRRSRIAYQIITGFQVTCLLVFLSGFQPYRYSLGFDTSF